MKLLEKRIFIKGRILGILMALLLSIDASAQIERGRYLIGGNADLSESFQGTTSTFNLSFAPSFAVFVVKGLAIGGRYAFSVSSQKVYDNTKKEYTTTTTFNTSVGPNLKYYLGKKPLKGVTSFSAGYLVSTRLRTNTVTNMDGFSVNGLIGMAYFFNQHLSLETGFYAQSTGYKKQLPTSRFGFSVGLFAFLDKKKQE